MGSAHAKKLQTLETGLTQVEAEERIRRYGPNRLPERAPPGICLLAIRQFRNPLIYILLIAAVVSFAVGSVNDALFIGTVLVINAAIGTGQEWKAEKSNLALKKLLNFHATVIRDGKQIKMEAAQLVPGDLVLIESGNRVPADLKLLSTSTLEIDESFLTGESTSVHKGVQEDEVQSDSVVVQFNRALAGSLVTRGRGLGLVFATGLSTQVGRVALDVIRESASKPPLMERMEHFTRVIAVATLLAAGIVGTAAFIIGSYSLSELLLFCAALAVSAIPEGLPVAITVALAVATSRMASRGVIVRHLAAVEGLGSCTMIATDKTGTLTCNALTVRQIYLPEGLFLEISGEGLDPRGVIRCGGQTFSWGKSKQLDALIRAGILCNEADLYSHSGEWKGHGDAVDLALLVLGYKATRRREEELERYPIVNQIPYEPELGFAASFHRDRGQSIRVFVKGAPEKILRMCDFQETPERLDTLEQRAVAFAEQGFRVLALADGRIRGLGEDDLPQELQRLRFRGFVIMQDPLRPGTLEAVRACQKAGIRVTMITGDHRATALAIARELGMAQNENEVLTGEQLKQMDEQQLETVLQDVRVFARTAPQQKLEIVKAAQRAGHFVAVTGDGVNDAPALQQANIGVAMGRSGTDIAREAAELVIRDDNFASIVAGVDEGRVAFDNIRKVIFLLVSTGAAQVLMVLLTILWGLPLPLLAVQLLWLNLVTNGIQGVALAFEPNEGDVLNRKPRPTHQAIFDRLMIERMLVAVSVMGGVGFVYFYALIELLTWELARARNALLLLMVLFENVHIGNCRSETKSAFTLSPLRSPMLLAGAICAFLLHLTAMHMPWGQAILGTYPVSLKEGFMILLLSLSVLATMELHRRSWQKRQLRSS